MSDHHSDFADDSQSALTPDELAIARRRHTVSVVVAILALLVVLVRWG